MHLDEIKPNRLNIVHCELEQKQKNSFVKKEKEKLEILNTGVISTLYISLKT